MRIYLFAGLTDFMIFGIFLMSFDCLQWEVHGKYEIHQEGITIHICK